MIRLRFCPLALALLLGACKQLTPAPETISPSLATQAATIYEQRGPLSRISYFSSSIWVLADDFTVPAGETWTFDQVDFFGPTPSPVAFTVSIYADNSDSVGEILHTFKRTSTVTDGKHQVSFDQVTLGAGTYWLGFSTDRNVIWSTSDDRTIGYNLMQTSNPERPLRPRLYLNFTLQNNGNTPDTTAPTLSFATPAESAVYVQHELVDVSYSCADEDGGSGLESCAGSQADRSPLATGTPGAYTFTVTAKDVAGNETTVTHAYRVEAAVPTADTFVIDAEGLPNREIYGVRVGQGISGSERSGRVVVRGTRVVRNRFRPGQHAKVLDLWGGKRLGVGHNRTNQLNPGGGRLRFVFPTFAGGLVTAKGIILYNVTQPGAVVALYRGKRLVKRLAVPQGDAGAPVKLDLDEPGISVVTVFARFPVAADDLVFEVAKVQP